MNLLLQIAQRWIVVAAGLWLLLTVAVWFFQERMLFIGAAPPLGQAHAPGVTVQPVDINVSADITLHGWYARSENAPSDARLPAILYFGGNAEEVSGVVAWAARLPDHAILAVNYRGYAGNPGNPSEESLKADALKLHDWLAARPDVDPKKISVAGRSLGSGVAIHVAAQRSTHRLLLITPYDSIASVAAKRFWFLPARLLLRHPFDSTALAAKVEAPTLFIIAAQDRVIPPTHARALAAVWPGSKHIVICPGRDHNNVLGTQQAWDAMRTALR